MDELKEKLIKENKILQKIVNSSIINILHNNPNLGYGELLDLYNSNTKEFNSIGIDIIEIYRKESVYYHET